MSKTDKIICLGKEFTSEDERREFFRNELRAKLPELKKIEGFPIGEDEDIINLSDPPYYTACPNPWLNDFIAEWEKEKESIPGRKKDFHVDEPYASDVSEGKYHPLYLKHPYHTKVPHIAIMKYLLHYTQPGDIVLDPFAGTGMTGVASQIIDNPDLQTKAVLESEMLKEGVQPKWGTRFSMCGDLSPAASFIAYNYNYPLNPEFASEKINNILNDVEKEFKWMYETNHHGTNKKGKINFVIWSDIFLCSNCSDEIVFWNDAVDVQNGIIKEEFNCPHCNTRLSKKSVTRKFRTFFDQEIQQTVRQALQIPVEINYTFGSKKFKKKPDIDDFNLIEKIETEKIKYWFPLYEIKKGEKTGEPIKLGINHVHQLYSKRNLMTLAAYAKRVNHPALLSILTAVAFRITKRYALT